jgi:glutathionylspermidine synthase
MTREERTPRPDYKAKIEALGLVFHTVEDKPYWNEAAAYRFERHEIGELESATNELHEMCLAAVEHVIGHELYSRLSIPTKAHRVIAESWEHDPPAIYGRFDLAYDGVHPPKLLEFNADTPTSLLEAAVIQWHWLQDVEPSADQFNSIWEGLVAKWNALKEEGLLSSGLVHFACDEVPEDLMTTAVMMDTANEAGLEPHLLYLQQIGWESINRRFVDEKHRPIDTIFKLYPWEWMLKDEFGDYALATLCNHQWIEPIWKMILSNKAILAILWELYPQHPNLLPTYLDGPRDLDSYVVKPILGREGANVTIVSSEGTVKNEGPYTDGGFVYQAYSPLPEFNGNHAVIGSWIVDCEARGIGIRESNGPITEDLARFVPHYFPAEKAHDH